MNRNPHERSNSARRQELRSEEESFRLQQEEGRLESGKRRSIFAWIINSIYLLVGMLEILLMLRFFLHFSGANTQNTFAQFIYNLSAPFIAPFSTLLISPVAGGGANVFDVNVLIAIIVYALLGWLSVWLVKFLSGR
ncbi:MAG: YggT family protein [Dolichospermum sp. LBC05a]|nr:YggT family protein [Dolichospermum sp. OL01]MCO5799072.1 YggT family protein [Dolichospermum sp. OL03]MCS6282681.1 YggT family protein [Dolichospermum sp.]QSV60458.1 MAG: YggT family protein [Dolichospermum sp. LBC05a]